MVFTYIQGSQTVRRRDALVRRFDFPMPLHKSKKFSAVLFK